MPETPASPRSQIYRTAFVSIVLMDAAILVVLIAIFGHAEWHSHLVRFTARVWRRFVTYNAGSTSPGFVSSILLSVLGVVVLALYIAYAKGRKALREHMAESAALAIFGVITVVFIVYGTQFAWEVAQLGYEDHTALATTLATTTQADKATIGGLNGELEKRRHTLETADPAVGNFLDLLRGFSIFRNGVHGESCVVYVTSPTESFSMASMVAQVSVATSNCPTFGPDPNFDRNPDLEKETMTGMVSNRIIFHAAKEDTAANELFMQIASLMPLKRSYDLPAHNNYQVPPGGYLHTVWLQFGTQAKWNSELREKQ